MLIWLMERATSPSVDQEVLMEFVLLFDPPVSAATVDINSFFLSVPSTATDMELIWDRHPGVHQGRV